MSNGAGCDELFSRGTEMFLGNVIMTRTTCGRSWPWVWGGFGSPRQDLTTNGHEMALARWRGGEG